MSHRMDPTHQRDSGADGARQRDARDDRGRLPDGTHDRRREPGELISRSAAIRNHCRECVGWHAGGLGSVAAAIRECPAVECWLWPWRNGPMGRERQVVELVEVKNSGGCDDTDS